MIDAMQIIGSFIRRMICKYFAVVYLARITCTWYNLAMIGSKKPTTQLELLYLSS